MADHATDLTNAPHAQALPDLVRRFERQLDEALATYGEITTALPLARLEMKLSAVVGHGVLEHFSEAGRAVLAARGHSVKGHRLVDKVSDALGVVYAAGDESPKPNDPGPRRAFTGAENVAPAPIA